MFKRRADGKIVKGLNGIYTLVPLIMKKRYDSMNLTTFKVELSYLDDFITSQKEATGIIYSYMDILAAAMVRTICLKPELNRFVVNSRIYQRNEITYSLAVQKSLKNDAEDNETTIKMHFTGEESISEIKANIDSNIKEAKHIGDETSADKLAKAINYFPMFIMKSFVGLVKLLDKIGLLPKSIIDVSPFHTTFFITDMRSIKLPTLNHHLYDFGTTGIFLATGPDEYETVVNKDGTTKIVRIMRLGCTTDERFCDGYYFAKAFRLFIKILKNPSYLLERLEKEEDHPEDEKNKHKKQHPKKDKKLEKGKEK